MKNSIGRSTRLSLTAVIAASLMLSSALAQDIGAGGVTGEQIRAVLDLESSDLAGDLKVDVGVVLALTGPGAFFGEAQGNGVRLAAAQIKEAGGPDLNLLFKDHRSGDAQSGARIARELGIERVPAALTSYVGVIASMFPGLAQYGILALDGGGGTSNFGQSQPFFWGMRAVIPDDSFAGAFKYWRAKNPDINTVSLVYIDQGPVNAVVEANFRSAAAEIGLEVASLETTAIGTTDYTATISRLGATAPDAVFVFTIGVDTGYFLRQFDNAGLDIELMGYEYVPDAAEVAGELYNDYVWTNDWFYAKQPDNDWSALFVESYQAEFGVLPEVNAANYYEDTFALWDLLRRVNDAGLEVTGENLQNALIENPSFASVYGGAGSEIGTVTLSTETHAVTTRPLGVFDYNDGDPVRLASFGIGGVDFQLED